MTLPPPERPTSPLDRLLRRLDLEQGNTGGSTHYVGHAGSRSVSVGTRIFGGLVVAQTIVAAGRALAPRQIHSIQQMFFRPGQAHIPLDYRVEPLFEGRTFSSARVEVWQENDMISHAQVGFSAASDGVQHRDPMPQAISPEAAVNRDELRGHPDWRDQPLECRVDPSQQHDTTPDYAMWFRAPGALPHDQLVQRALVGYVSDRAMLGVAWKPHAHDHGSSHGATLNHTVWFHDHLDVSAWHLHAMHSPAAGASRGMIFGGIYHRDGLLVASTSQEGVIRSAK